MVKFNHEVRINPTHNGIIVQVGCKTLCFEQSSIGTFLADLAIYLKGGEQAMIEKYFPEMLAEPREGRVFVNREGYVTGYGAPAGIPVDAPDPRCAQQATTNNYL